MKASEYNISSEKFVFANNSGKIHDKELVTKPVGYFKDAFYRFKRNKASIVATVIIGILLLFALIGPWFTPYPVAYNDTYFRYNLPRLELMSKLNIHFWDGGQNKTSSFNQYVYLNAMDVETGHEVIMDGKYTTFEKEDSKGNKTTVYKYRVDSYQTVGIVYQKLNQEQYVDIQKYQDEKGIQIIYPMTDLAKRPTLIRDSNNPNIWYATKAVGNETIADITQNADGTINYTNIYLPENGTDNYTSKMRVEGSDSKLYTYASIVQNNQYEVRLNYYEYYIYQHTTVLKDGIKKPSFLFGSTNYGKDIFGNLASGARLSFLIAIVVAIVNLIVGSIFGAIEGYYGGIIDLLLERFIDILASVPFMIVITLLNYHMEGSSQILILFIAFFLTGWIGIAARTRMQFYRFKNQEYVLASRTLGAKDGRIMFKHIFPNALGTLITGSVLIIPGMIFSESSLSYLGIINLNTGNVTSVGTLLANAQPFLSTYPYMIVFPSIFISLLMLSFNLFGNGLRDAFNPSLRGSED